MSRVSNQFVTCDEAEVAFGSVAHVTELANGTTLTHARKLNQKQKHTILTRATKLKHGN